MSHKLKLLPKVCLFDFVRKGVCVFVQQVTLVSWEEVNTCWETVGADFKLLFQCSHHVAAPYPCWCKVSKAGSDHRRLLLFAWRIRGTRRTAALSLLQHDTEWWGKARFLAQHCSSS